jgi:4-aminobutyrate aminotransferase-like enzyme
VSVQDFAPHVPDMRVPPPGPRSQALAARLRRVECPDTTYLSARFPVFWDRASGANVWDADGNRYVDSTAAFGVALAGHGHPAVVAAIVAQSARLAHGMGDVHPTEIKVQLAEELAALAPGDLGVTLFGNSGSDAIEAALKTAALVTGQPGVLAFEGAYHGLGHGALAATWRDDFRAPFRAQLNPHVVHVPYPTSGLDSAAAALDRVDAALAANVQLGGVLVEPVLGRGGIVVPHPSFLAGLREICTRRGRLLICDEVLTGLGRTGRWFACEHSGVVPDLLCAGKVLGGGLPLSACVGTPAVMEAWGVSNGEARHTFTHLGNPLACAAGLATLDVLRSVDAPALAVERGAALGAALEVLATYAGVGAPHGLGLLWGVDLVDPDGAPDRRRTFEVVVGALQRGVFVLADGTHRNVLAFSPPLCLADSQITAAIEALAAALEAGARS